MTSTPTPEPTSTPSRPVNLNRGINFGNMLEAPNEGDWGLRVQEEYFDRVKAGIFDFVRLPVCWSTRGTGGSIRDRPNFLARVDEVVNWALNRDLTYEDGPGEHVWPYWDKMIQNVLAWMFSRERKL